MNNLYLLSYSFAKYERLIFSKPLLSAFICVHLWLKKSLRPSATLTPFHSVQAESLRIHKIAIAHSAMRQTLPLLILK